jgi:hypothetical protein
VQAHQRLVTVIITSLEIATASAATGKAVERAKAKLFADAAAFAVKHPRFESSRDL